MAILIYKDGTDPGLPEYKFYNGQETLRFDANSWKYYRVTPDGMEPLCGVTTVLHKVLDRSEALVPWAVKKALAKAKQLIMATAHPDTGVMELFQDELITILETARKADKDELNAAGETGHTAHAWIEQIIKATVDGNEGRRLELLSKLPLDPRAANCCIAAVEWMCAHNVKWVATERKIYSRKHGYAGTMDGLAYVSSCSDPSCCPEPFIDRLTLVDWKTSNYLYLEYLLQTGAYKQAHEEETGEKIEDRWIIRLGKDDAEFDPWHVSKECEHEQDIQAFLQAIEFYKSVLQIEDRVAVLKESRRAIEKEKKAAERRIKCLKADEYKGTRKKKGCNDTDQMCQTCQKKYEENAGRKV